MKRVELLGKTFGITTVTKKLGSRNGSMWWQLKCECGAVIERTTYRAANTLTCGYRCPLRSEVYNHHADLLGRVFGHTTVTQKLGLRGNRIWWELKCECGNTFERPSEQIPRFITCGWHCPITRAGHSARQTRHRMAGSRPYQTWSAMIGRCCNPKDKSWRHYGGRGISVCDRWRECFDNFWRDMQLGYAENLQIDRINPNGDYCPDNCRWVTPTEQARNKRTSLQYKYPDLPSDFRERAQLIGLNVGTIAARLSRNWTAQQAMEPTKKPKEKQFI